MSSRGMDATRFGLILSACIVLSAPLRAQDQPKVLGAPEVRIDKSTGAGSTTLYFRNDSAKPLTISLSTGPVTISGTSKVGDAQVFFGPENDSGPGSPEYTFTLNVATTTKIKTFVVKAWGASRIDTDLLNGVTHIGKLLIFPSAMNVNLLEPAPDKAELELTDGAPARIILKNDDPISYPLSFRLIVDGRQIAGNNFQIPSQGTSILEFAPNMAIEWLSFSSYVPSVLKRLQEVFKPEALKGSALYLYQGDGPVNYSSPVKIIPLNITFNYFSKEWRTTLNYVLIIGLLSLGGIASLTIGHALPNLLQRLDIVEQLNELARNIANLSSNIESRLGVLIRLERSRLHDLLTSRTTISPDFDTTVSQCKSGVAKLGSRVALLQQLDTVIGKLSRLARAGAPPSQIYDIQRALQQTCEILKKVNPSDTDLQDSQKSIATASMNLDSINRPNPDFGKTLAQRIQDACTNVLPAIASKPTFGRVSTAVPGPTQVLQTVPPGTTEIAPSLYVSVDTALSKLEIIYQYVEFAEGTADPQVKARLQQKEGQLISYLSVQSWEALQSAELLLQEMKEDLYPERLYEALAASPVEASIKMEPAVAYTEEPLEFSIYFSNVAINSAIARQEWICNWNFGDRLQSQGWLVSHYFILPKVGPFRRRTAQTFDVTASFQDQSGKQVIDPGTRNPIVVTSKIEVHPTRLRALLGERTIAEIARLSVALLIAVFGLVAGVKDQLVKLDVLPGLAAIFAAGYGVDVLKNLMGSNKSS